MDFFGRHTLNGKIRTILKELRELPGISKDEKARLKALQKKEFYDKAISSSPDELETYLVDFGISPLAAQLFTDKAQLAILELAKANPSFFYEFVADAEVRQLEGIQEIKEALGLAGDPRDPDSKRENIRRLDIFFRNSRASMVDRIAEGQAKIKADTEALLEGQQGLATLLRDIRERLVELEVSSGRRSRTSSDTGMAARDIHEKLGQILGEVKMELVDGEVLEASQNLLRASRAFFELYQLYESEIYYELGNRCYSQAMAFKSSLEGRRFY